MPSRACLAAIAGALLLSACLPAAPASVAAPSTVSSSSPLPAASASPAPAVSFPEVVLVPGAGAAGRQVVGLVRNDSSLPLRDVSLTVEFLDHTGASLASITAPLLLPALQPGSSSPFRAAVPSGLDPADARATLSGYHLGARIPIAVALGSVSMAASPDGMRLLGLVRNEGTQPLAIRQLAVVWRDAEGRLAGAGMADIPPVPVPPDGHVPWTALAPGAVEAGAVDIFAAATTLRQGDSLELEVSSGPAWHRTSQGRGFATGEIRNTGALPLLPVIAVALWAQGELVGLDILRSAVPLPPGETLAYGAEAFPSLDERLEHLGVDGLDVEPSVIASGTAAPAAPELRLDIAIHHFEVIGSRIYLGGTLIRTGDQPLAGAEIRVALRSVDGQLQSAAWLPIAPGSPGVPVPFRLDLPLPAGVQAELSEIDLRAVGLPFSP